MGVVRTNKKLKDFEVYTVGVSRKIERKASLQARSETEAESKGKLFSKVAGVTFSHIKQINK
jgi:hypothetical protein